MGDALVFVHAQKLLDERGRFGRRDQLDRGTGPLDAQTAALTRGRYLLDGSDHVGLTPSRDARQRSDFDGFVGHEEDAFDDYAQVVAIGGHSRGMKLWPRVAGRLVLGLLLWFSPKEARS